MSAPTMHLPTTGTFPRQTTAEALEAEVDRLVKTLWDQQSAIASGSIPAGDWDPNSGSFPATAVVGTFYNVIEGGTLDGVVFERGNRIYPLVPNASTATYQDNWSRTSVNNDGQRYHRIFANVAALAADTNVDYPIGARVHVEEEYFDYVYVGTSGGVFPNSATTPRRFNPLPVPYFGIDIRACGGPAGLGADNHAAHQAAIDYADSIGAGVYLGINQDYEGRSTYVWGSCDIAGYRCSIFTPPTGTYNSFVYDSGAGAGVTQHADNVPCAHDFSGNGRQFYGNITLLGQTGLSDWKYDTRLTCNDNLAGFGGLRSSPADAVIVGALTVQGFGYPWYVPNQETDQQTRGLTRWRGRIRVRFCGVPFGQIGLSSNGVDDTALFIRSDRCGSWGNVRTDSRIVKGSLNVDVVYARGLKSDSDFEPQTVTVDGTNVIELSAETSNITANDWIVVGNAYRRASDNALMNLVCKVQSVAGRFVTLYDEVENVPTETSSGNLLYIRPPGVDLATGGKVTARHCYIEDVWDQWNFQNKSMFVCHNFKIGGANMSGRNGSVLNTTGMMGRIELHLENTVLETNKLEAIVGVGLLRQSNTGRDSEWTVEIFCQQSVREAEAEVIFIKGNNPLEFFTSPEDPLVNRFGFTHQGNNIIKHFAGQEHHGVINPNGAYSTRFVWSRGRIIAGTFGIEDNAKLGGRDFNVEADGTVQPLIQFVYDDGGTTIDQFTSYPPGLWHVYMSSSTKNAFCAAIVHINASNGFVTVTTLASNQITLSKNSQLLRYQYTGAVTPGPTVTFNCTAYRVLGQTFIPGLD